MVDVCSFCDVLWIPVELHSDKLAAARQGIPVPSAFAQRGTGDTGSTGVYRTDGQAVATLPLIRMNKALAAE
ncbi:MAG: hypothetical protein JXL80_04610 [Planctomycetes bacterium]|nr:hypothetical protein [Planctomycetota bacterium]